MVWIQNKLITTDSSCGGGGDLDGELFFILYQVVESQVTEVLRIY